MSSARELQLRKFLVELTEIGRLQGVYAVQGFRLVAIYPKPVLVQNTLDSGEKGGEVALCVAEKGEVVHIADIPDRVGEGCQHLTDLFIDCQHAEFRSDMG